MDDELKKRLLETAQLEQLYGDKNKARLFEAVAKGTIEPINPDHPEEGFTVRGTNAPKPPAE